MPQNDAMRAHPVCGCGTVGEALDTAYRAVAAEKDCYHWHSTVEAMIILIRGNLLARKAVAEGDCTREHAQDYVNAINSAQSQRAMLMCDANADQIAEWCDALFESNGGFLS